MNVVVIVFLLLIVSFFVGYPLVKPEYEGNLLSSGSTRAKLKSEKEAVMTTLNEIEFDYKMGKLSEDDYQIMKNKYKLTALEILKEEEDGSFRKKDSIKNDARNAKSIDDEIEEELKKLRAEKKTQKQ